MLESFLGLWIRTQGLPECQYAIEGYRCFPEDEAKVEILWKIVQISVEEASKNCVEAENVGAKLWSGHSATLIIKISQYVARFVYVSLSIRNFSDLRNLFR